MLKRNVFVLILYISVQLSFYAVDHDIYYNYALQGVSPTLDKLILSTENTTPSFRVSHNKKTVIVRIKIDNFNNLLEIFNELEIKASKIEYLDISFCGVNDLSGLEKCKNIRYLDISHNNIKCFPNLSEFPCLTEIHYDNNNFSKKEELKIKKFLAKIDFDKIRSYEFKDDAEYENFINQKYQEAEKLFDIKKYQEAVVEYQEVVNAFEYHNNDIIGVSLDTIDSTIKKYEKLYFSLYNISCCYSLLGNFDETEEYLGLAIKSGYPYLEYISNDKDLKAYFEKVPEGKKRLVDIYNAGNSNEIIAGKTLRYWYGPSSGMKFSFSSESDSIIRKRVTDSFNKDFYYGNYYVKNYFIVCHFYKNAFLNNKGFVVGIGIKEEDCEKIEREIDVTTVVPFYLIENVKTYFDWPSLSYEFD